MVVNRSQVRCWYVRDANTTVRRTISVERERLVVGRAGGAASSWQQLSCRLLLLLLVGRVQ